MDNSSDLDSKKSKRKKVDPSFKSKRYRDKLRAEVKALENLIPVDRPTLNKKLDSQTIYRLAIAYLRVKAYVNARKLKLETPRHWLKPRMNLDAGHTVETIHHCDEHVQEHSNRMQNKPSPIGNSQNPKQIQTGSRAFDETFIGFGSKHDSTPDPAILYQIIDGFVLMVSADGTIMFVTENVSKYTGFNQTDLMHRCLYSIVHPQDYSNVRYALEQFHVTQTAAKNERIQPDIPQDSSGTDGDVIENFFCRIRCYHGNTPRYMKLHCSGKSNHLLEMPKTVQTSNSVVLLYCQPFMKTGSDVMNDSNKEVFWSKHDLDLKFKEIEETATCIPGYSSSDVCGKSLYQFVHPEDLSTIVNVHKAVTRVTEVQTFFYRMEMKHAGWLWMYCKGKVICKNSKKFSIVFSHSPVRDEDNVFIKQEALLRRRSLVGFLQCSAVQTLQQQGQPQEKFHMSNQLLQNQCHNPHSSNVFLQREDPLTNGPETDGRVLFSPLDILHMPCPSSWHADNDRHSPVLPNSHAVQKILTRERQLCMAEYRKKQKFEQTQSFVAAPLTHHRNDVILNQRTNQGMVNGIHAGAERPNFYSHLDSFANIWTPSLSWNPSYNNYIDDYGHDYTCPSMQQFNYPCHNDINNFYVPSPPTPLLSNQYFPYDQKQEIREQRNSLFQCAKRIADNCAYGFPYHDVQGGKMSPAVPNVHNFYSSANVRFSMVCNTDVSMNNHAMHDNNAVSKTYETNYTEKKSKSEIKSERRCDNYCVMSEKIVPAAKQSVKYDIEASVYMRIVEAQERENSKTNIDLPVYSNLVALCENQPVPVLKQCH